MDLILKPFGWLLLMLYNLVSNYGIALFIFAILVKIILFPFSLKGKKSMIQMNMLSAKTQKLQKMYGNNKAKYNEEVQKLYEKEKVNPMGGCLWSLLPLFILIPLYGVIRQPLRYMMGLSAEQIGAVAAALNWESVAVNMGWIKKAATFAESTGAYNELYLASLITPENLSAVQAAAGEGAKVFAMNFNFLGIDLSQVPTWKFWANGMDWTTIGLFLLVVVSAVSSIISSKVMMKTNNTGAAQNAQAAQTNKTMMWMTPIMSIWIGFMMPGLLNIYWVANNILAMVQEILAGKILKKDYEEAARVQAETELKEKEEEKERKRKLAEKKAREAEEAKKNKKKAVKPEEKRDASNTGASRVGMRAYARGRAYDPDRFGGVTPYRDPSAPIDETAVETALAAKEQKAEEAAAEEVMELTAPVEETAALPVEEASEAAAPISEEAVEDAEVKE